jgi:hypothetical protein
LHSGSANITYDGLNVDCGGMKTQGACFENGGGATNAFRNGSIGNVVDEKAALVDGNNFTFDNVRFHDAVLRTDGAHMECVYAIVVPSFTVRNSSFSNCAVVDLFFTYGDWWSPLPPPYGNVTVEREPVRADLQRCRGRDVLHPRRRQYGLPGTGFDQRLDRSATIASTCRRPASIRRARSRTASSAGTAAQQTQPGSSPANAGCF